MTQQTWPDGRSFWQNKRVIVTAQTPFAAGLRQTVDWYLQQNRVSNSQLLEVFESCR